MADYTSPEYGISITLPAIPLFVPDAARAAIDQLLVEQLRLALQYIAGAVSQEAPVDSGNLAQSFSADPATSTGGIEIEPMDASGLLFGRVFSSLPHAIVMDQGRRPGSPISREGIDAIGLWARRKLGLSEKEADRAKWAIAFSIIQNGIDAKLYVSRGFENARGQVEAMFAALADAIRRELTAVA